MSRKPEWLRRQVLLRALSERLHKYGRKMSESVGSYPNQSGDQLIFEKACDHDSFTSLRDLSDVVCCNLYSLIFD